jgi:hypothetical protein
VKSRALRISLLVLMAIWFGVVVPVHPRGMIRLGGSCTENLRACCRNSKGAGHESRPARGNSDCAICFFVATLDLPPAMEMDVPKLGLVEETAWPAPQVGPVQAWTDAVMERGPPGV